MLTDEQKDYIIMGAEERVSKAKKELILFIWVEIFIEFILIMLLMNKSDMLIGFIIANIVMLLYLVYTIFEYMKNPYMKVGSYLADDRYILDVGYLTNIKEETAMTRHRRVIHTGRFVGCTYKETEKMDVLTDFLLEYQYTSDLIDRQVTLVEFPGVKDDRKGYAEEFTLLYLAKN